MGFCMDSFAARVHSQLLSRGETVAVAESCTGGRICSEFSSVPGASRSFRGGIVAYQRSVKEGVLGVPSDIIQEYGIISVQTAVSMAMGAARVLDAQWGLASTGICGPGSPDKSLPLGCVCLAVAYQAQSQWDSPVIKVWSEKHFFTYHNRLQVQLEATRYLLEVTESLLNNGF